MTPAIADALIIGAGPAGCAAAFDLCGAGISVLLLDKNSFPRDKPCAGGVSVKALMALRYSIAPVVRKVCKNFVAGYAMERVNLFRSSDPIAAMTVRSELDAYCLAQCVRRGATFKTIEPIQTIHRVSNGWEVCTRDGAVFLGKYLVGADGANSIVRRMLCDESHLRMGFAIEACVPQCGQREMEMDFHVVDRGYAWVFPKGDHLNVGLFTLDPTIRHASRRLSEHAMVRIGNRNFVSLRGHRIPHNGQGFRHERGGPLLVGDAAGFVDLLLGEGIYNAIRSGQIAAAAIHHHTQFGIDNYGTLIREISGDLSSDARGARAFYGYPALGFCYLTLPPIRYVMMKEFALGFTFQQIRRKFVMLPCLPLAGCCENVRL